MGSSPHTRGAPRTLAKLPPVRRDHPRIRGEHHDIPLLGVLARGIIPAYAGSTTDVVCASVEYEGSSPHTRGARWTARGRRPPPGDHPRIRGEHDWPCLVRDQELGIIPAYAGSTPHHTIHCESSEGSSPHTRGALSGPAERCASGPGSSPHTRGALRRTPCASSSARDHPRIRGEHERLHGAGEPLGGIIPAYAGSTIAGVLLHCLYQGSSPHTRGARMAAPACPTARWDHPRIRGEHLRAGSLLHIIQGIIPAYAGSTR